MHYYKFNIKDWTRDTAHLSVEEEGVYRRLLDLYYESECPIPLETQPVIRRLRMGGHEQTVTAILAEFFSLEADGYRHARCDDEIAKYHAKAEANRANGGKGGRPKKPTENPDGFELEPTENLNHKPPTTNQEPTESKSSCDQQAESREPAPKINYQRILVAFREKLPNLPQPRKLEDDRKRAIRTIYLKDERFQEEDFFDRYFGYVSESEFLMNWKGCGFDWLFQPKNFRKVIEGNYHGGREHA